MSLKKRIKELIRANSLGDSDWVDAYRANQQLWKIIGWLDEAAAHFERIAEYVPNTMKMVVPLVEIRAVFGGGGGAGSE